MGEDNDANITCALSLLASHYLRFDQLGELEGWTLVCKGAGSSSMSSVHDDSTKEEAKAGGISSGKE